MKKIGNKDELIVYGDDSIQLLQHIIDGISNNPVKSTTYSIDFSRLKKLKISIKKKFYNFFVLHKFRFNIDFYFSIFWIWTLLHLLLSQ